jgi:DnaK suppressor protein
MQMQAVRLLRKYFPEISLFPCRIMIAPLSNLASCTSVFARDNHQFDTIMAAKKAAKKSPAPVAKKSTSKKPEAAPAKKAVASKASAPANKAAAPAKKVAAPAKKAAPPAAKPVVKKSAPAPQAAKPAVKVEKSKAAEPVAAPKAKSPTPATPKKIFTPPPSKPVFSPDTIIVEPITDPKFLAFTQKQKQRLLDLRDEIVDAMTGSAREAIRSSPEGSEASGSGMHQGDAGSDAYDRDFALSVLAKDQDALYEIEEALLRIKKGTYGLCEMSGKPIPIPRLEAIPFARLTVDCQAQWEKEYGTKKFRPSGSIGFSGGGIFDEDEDSDTISLDEDED